MIIFPDSLIHVGLPVTGGIIYGGITRGAPIAGSLVGDSTAVTLLFNPGDALLLETGIDFLLLEGVGTDKLLLEPQ